MHPNSTVAVVLVIIGLTLKSVDAQRGPGGPTVVSGCSWKPQHNSTLCDGGCTYNTALQYCYSAGCTTLRAAVGCELVSGCAWDEPQGICLDYNIRYGTYNCSRATAADL